MFIEANSPGTTPSNLTLLRQLLAVSDFIANLRIQGRSGGDQRRMNDFFPRASFFSISQNRIRCSMAESESKSRIENTAGRVK